MADKKLKYCVECHKWMTSKCKNCPRHDKPPSPYTPVVWTCQKCGLEFSSLEQASEHERSCSGDN